MDEGSVAAGGAEPTSVDTLVVGAGMAGLYATWRLHRAGRAGSSIRIVESLDRTGGRLETDVVCIDGTEVRTEEGGMRFMFSQRELMQLLHDLDLWDDVVPFPMGDDHNIFYLRGKRFTRGEAKEKPKIWSRLYHLNKSAKGKQPGEILQDVLRAILKENGMDPDDWNPTPDDWTRLRLEFTYKGIPTYKWGFWAVLDDFGLTRDCVQMLFDSSGFIAPYDQEINVGCAMQLLVDFVDPNFHHLRQGYQLLPDTLVNKIERAGTKIHLQHEVKGIDRLEDGRLRVSTVTPEGTRDFICKDLILGVTQMGLQRLVPYVPMFRDSEQFLSDVESVTDMALGKINFYYTERWWAERLGITSGGSFTDLPLAQFYCFTDPGESPDYDGPASMTIYTDYFRANFWSELQAVGEPYHSDMFPENPPRTVPATTKVVEAATRQMQEMFGLDELPAPVLTTYKRWTDPSMGDGDHQWRIGVDDIAVRDRLTMPFEGVHVCGETYSDDQTWVNGALRSVDEMLQTRFGIPNPTPSE